MVPEARKGWRRFSRTQQILLIAATVIFVLATVGVALLLRYWPFDQKQIAEILQETVPGTKVTIARFHSTYFPHPGCSAEGVLLVRHSTTSGFPPLVAVETLLIQANYADLFLRPGYISRIVLGGLRIQVPPRGSNMPSGNTSLPADARSKRTVVGEVSSVGAVLKIGRSNNPPLVFEIHSIRLHSVGLDRIMSYSVELRNPLPPGEIRSSGKIGPWNAHDLGQIPVSGVYKFVQADLGVFSGIQGILSSTGQFDGRLVQMEVSGETNMPDFAVKTIGRTLPLKSRFQAEVNGMNGDVKLAHVNVLLQDTPIEVRGSITGRPGVPGKMTSLDLFANKGQVQDVLRPFVKVPVPPMSGPIDFRAHVILPPDKRRFLKRVALIGDFTISHGRFTKAETQHSVDGLSQSSQGVKNKSDDPSTVEADLASHVNLSNGVAQFSNLSFDVPGAGAQMKGSFNILNEKVDFHGMLKTNAELSDTTHGIKAVLLKPLDPLFKRKHHGAVIPVEMTGTYPHPHFGVEVIPKH